jgi:hypothetical protein
MMRVPLMVLMLMMYVLLMAQQGISFLFFTTLIARVQHERRLKKPLVMNLVCTPPFMCFSFHTIIDTATRRRYDATMLHDGIQDKATNLCYETNQLSL